MIGQKLPDHVFRRKLLLRLLLESRHLRKLGQRPRAHVITRTDAFGDFVHDLIQFLVLALEEFVQVMKVKSPNVQWEVTCLGVQHILIRQKGLQYPGNTSLSWDVSPISVFVLSSLFLTLGHRSDQLSRPLLVTLRVRCQYIWPCGTCRL